MTNRRPASERKLAEAAEIDYPPTSMNPAPTRGAGSRPGDPKMGGNETGKEVADAAVKVHPALGPGLLKSAREVALAKGLEIE